MGAPVYEVSKDFLFSAAHQIRMHGGKCERLHGHNWRVVVHARSSELNREQSRKSFKNLLNPYLNPHGIKEMAETKGLRSAYAVAQLLNSLEIGGVDDRLNALRSLRLEVIDTAEGPMPKNTARVLLQIMKNLVRAYGDPRAHECSRQQGDRQGAAEGSALAVTRPRSQPAFGVRFGHGQALSEGTPRVAP